MENGDAMIENKENPYAEENQKRGAVQNYYSELN